MLVSQPNDVVTFALSKWKNVQHFQIEDAYKWLFQATRGGEHAAFEAEKARTLLEAEWRAAGDFYDGESCWEPLTPNAEIGRLHLRPFKSKASNSSNLLGAFLNSALSFNGDADRFVACWNEFGGLLKKQNVGALSKSEWGSLNEKMLAADFPAVSHSDIYKKAYRPSYRILTLSEFEKLFMT